MHYAASLPFRGRAEEAFGLAEAALTALGFRLTDRSADVREWVGPGMNSSRESALLGASRIHVAHGGGELAVEADLGGVARLARFVTWFPVLLPLVLGLVLAGVFAAVLGPGPWLAMVAVPVGLNVALWLVLGPWMARRFKARTDRALDALLANMVAAGESDRPRGTR